MTTSSYCPPMFPSTTGLLGSWVNAWAAAADGLADGVVSAWERGPFVPDVARWLQVTVTRRPPSWTTPHEVVFEAPIARLRDFSTSRRRSLIPTLVLPPQAGHDSCIVDYSSEQSQMGTIVGSGLERALSLDWIGATPDTAGATVEDYLEVVDRAIEHCGGRVNLVGDCQGGWLATIYAALEPERVNTLTIAGAPIDFHAGEPVIHEVMSHLIQPGTEIARQIELLWNIDDPQHVARYRGFEDWFKYTQDLPGAFYLWIVRHLFRDNALIGGELEIGGRRVDLAKLDMPLNLLAGETDHITPPDQVFALAQFASTPPELERRRLSAGGHLGLFMGHEALHEHWPPLLAEVLTHSTVKPSPGTAKPVARAAKPVGRAAKPVGRAAKPVARAANQRSAGSARRKPAPAAKGSRRN
jgi:poly(3-hydroxybutyrate) depolymerase